MKISFKLRIMFILMATVAGAIIVTWALNETFLEKYYTETKIKTLKNAYEKVENILEKYEGKSSGDTANIGTIKAVSLGITKTSDSDNDEFFRGQGGKENIPDVRPNMDSESFLEDEDALELEVLGNRNSITIYLLWNYRYYFSTENGNGRSRVFADRINHYTGNDPFANEEDDEIIYSGDKRYTITKVYDNRTNSSYIELYSNNKSGDDFSGTVVLLRSNLESIKDNVRLSNTFLLYAGLFVLIVTMVISNFVSGSVVKPIRQLSDIARSVSRLDFNNKYDGKAGGEIDTLGNSINTMSKKLEQTISDLKSANNRLQTDIEQKVQIDEMRKEFLSNVTHELKTPIALISGYAEGLKDCINDDPESRDYYCDVIIDEARKMNEMVKKLLTLNKIEFGSGVLELERFNISEMMRSVIRSSSVLIKNKNIDLLYNIPDELFVWADEYLIEEVFTNYLTNAVNHCENELKIEVKAEKKEKTARISVFNSGKPIPEEELGKIWIKFYKVDKARTREYGGTGIGLSIVKAVMDAHNKPYGVINHLNGVEFWFELDAGENG